MRDPAISAQQLLAKGIYGEALLKAMQDLASAKESGERRLQVEASVMIAEIYMQREQPEMALQMVKDALLCCKAMGDKKAEALVLQTVANAFLMVSANEAALRVAKQLQAVTEALGDKAGQADSRLVVAQACLSRGDLSSAVQRAQEALDLFKAAGGKRGAAVALQTLAEAHIKRRDGDAALKAGKEAAASFQEIGEAQGQAAALNAAAGALQLRGETDEGLKLAREALLLFHQANDSKGERLAKATCACLRAKAEVQVPKQMPKIHHHNVPGTSGVGTQAADPFVDVYRFMGSAESKQLAGTVCAVTGASRGIGKGVATLLAEAGAIVYVTGRSAPGKVSDQAMGGTVDETAGTFAKMGGVGVALHLDHAQKSQSKALAELLANNHGRLDLLVNNAFTLPGPDENFYGTELWRQPVRYLNEQSAVGNLNHATQTLFVLALLRRGKGLAVSISNVTAQSNVASLPVSFFCSKAAYDRTMSALAERVRHAGVYVLTLWPGIVRTERTKAMAQRARGAKLIDAELSRFSGLAVRQLASMQTTELSRLASTRRTLACTDIAKFDVDGYAHEGGLQTFTTGGRAALSP